MTTDCPVCKEGLVPEELLETELIVLGVAVLTEGGGDRGTYVERRVVPYLEWVDVRSNRCLHGYRSMEEYILRRVAAQVWSHSGHHREATSVESCDPRLQAQIVRSLQRHLR